MWCQVLDNCCNIYWFVALSTNRICASLFLVHRVCSKHKKPAREIWRHPMDKGFCAASFLLALLFFHSSCTNERQTKCGVGGSEHELGTHQVSFMIFRPAVIALRWWHFHILWCKLRRFWTVFFVHWHQYWSYAVVVVRVIFFHISQLGSCFTLN